MPGDNIAEHRIIAAIGHMDHADAGHGLQQLGKQVLDRPIAARAERQLAGIVLGKRDEVGERVHAQVRRHHEHERSVADHCDRHKIPHRIVGRVLVHVHGDRERRGAAEQQRVTVGRGLGDRRGPDHGASAGPVLDQQGFAQPLLQQWLQLPCNHVEAPAGRKRNDEGDRPTRIVLRGRPLQAAGGCEGAQPELQRLTTCPIHR